MVAKTLDASINIPDLDQEGYVLAGLGVYPDQAHGHAIQVNYRNGDGRLLTVYLRHPTGADRYEILPERNGKRVCVWESQELSAVMVGEMSEQEMLRTAYLAYHALNF
jgi:anti-sigma factor RsiW